MFVILDNYNLYCFIIIYRYVLYYIILFIIVSQYEQRLRFYRIDSLTKPAAHTNTRAHSHEYVYLHILFNFTFLIVGVMLFRYEMSKCIIKQRCCVLGLDYIYMLYCYNQSMNNHNARRHNNSKCIPTYYYTG